MRSESLKKGFTFIEVIIVIGLIGLFFVGILSAVKYTIALMRDSGTKTSALSLAMMRLEYIRSLPYEQVGTVGGVPSGDLLQFSTTTLNGTLFFERLLIQYVDAPEDGEGSFDENGIMTDYKEARVEYSWRGENGTSSIFLLSKIAPQGIETTGGGGTIRVNVFDSTVMPVEGAEVRFFNDTTTSTISTIRYTNENGIAYLGGAPVASNYRISATKSGYSVDQTYEATGTNPNPVTPLVSVLAGSVSTMNFQIDRLARLSLSLFSEPVIKIFDDSFDNETNIGSRSGTENAGGETILTGGPLSYQSTGIVRSVTIAPSPLFGWDMLSFERDLEPQTSVRLRVYEDTGSDYSLIGEDVLPGNSEGFSDTAISLRSLDATRYPRLMIEAMLESSSTNATPRLLSWTISSFETYSQKPSFPFSFRGTKVIGTSATGTPLYKFAVSTSTDTHGNIAFPNLEWDAYIFVPEEGFVIKEACDAMPRSIDAGSENHVALTVGAQSARSLRVRVIDSGGTPILGASVTLFRPGFNEIKMTGACGEAYFANAPVPGSDYSLNVFKNGFSTSSISSLQIAEDEYQLVTLIP